MIEKPYNNRDLLFSLYITRKMGIVKIAEYLKKEYGVSVTAQTIYNALERYDILKYKGKGRKKASYQGVIRQAPKSKTGGVYAKRPRSKQRKLP